MSHLEIKTVGGLVGNNNTFANIVFLLRPFRGEGKKNSCTQLRGCWKKPNSDEPMEAHLCDEYISSVWWKSKRMLKVRKLMPADLRRGVRAKIKR